MRISCLKFSTLLGVFCGLFLSAHAAWYWPFDFDPDSTNKPPRLHRLLEKANEYIELAEDDMLEGRGDKAIENYHLALKELDRVEEENPDRVESPEFAPLRTKRATCSAAIDSIRFAQVDENERAVAVSNTKDLERRWRIKHGLQTFADEAYVRREEAKTNTVGRVERSEVTNAVVQSAQAPEAGGDAAVVQSTAANVVAAAKTDSSKTLDGRRAQALERLRAGDYAAADLAFEGLLKEQPEDLNLMLLRSAAQAGGGSLYASRRTLEKAMRIHPESYLPCYNLANLMLRIDPDSAIAGEYYEKGRKLGGPRIEALEKKVNRE